MKTHSYSWVPGLLAATLALANIAAADGPIPDPQRDLVSFFERLEGSWDGDGVRLELMANGRFEETKYDLEMDVDDEWNDEWDVRTEVTTDRGSTTIGTTRFGVRSGHLFMGQYSATEPVAVARFSPSELEYSFRRIDFSTGRIYDWRVTADLSPDGRRMRGTNRVEMNGVVVLDDRYVARK